MTTYVYEIGQTSPALNTWTTITVTGQSLFRDTRTNVTGTLASFQAGEIGSVPVNFFQVGYGSTGGTFDATNSNVDYIELNGTTWDFEAVSSLPPQPTVPSAKPIPTMSQWALILLALSLGLVAFSRRKQLK